MDFREADVPCHLAGRLKICFGLSGKAHDEIGRERWPIEGGSQSSPAFQEAGDAIPAFHCSQDLVRAALQTEVQMRADSPRTGNGFHQLAADLCRLQTAQTNPEISRQRIEMSQQMPQPAPIGFHFATAEVDAVVAQMDARQHYLTGAILYELSYFLSDLLDGPAAQDRPNMGNDAITAIQ